jgi:hypothetical protein
MAEALLAKTAVSVAGAAASAAPAAASNVGNADHNVFELQQRTLRLIEIVQHAGGVLEDNTLLKELGEVSAQVDTWMEELRKRSTFDKVTSWALLSGKEKRSIAAAAADLDQRQSDVTLAAVLELHTKLAKLSIAVPEGKTYRYVYVAGACGSTLLQTDPFSPCLCLLQRTS